MSSLAGSLTQAAIPDLSVVNMFPSLSTPQSSHVVWPLRAWYLPGVHSVHETNAGALETCPATQSKHTGLPRIDATLPAAHLSHELCIEESCDHPRGHLAQVVSP